MIKMRKKIKNLCNKYLKYGKNVLDGYNCGGVKCEECPFSNHNNNGIYCEDDSKENYNKIAKKYLKDYKNFRENKIIKTKYKEGDRVKVREDLEENRYIGFCISDTMKRYKGKIVTIDEAFIDDGEDNYHIKEDNGKYYWCNDMIEDK